MKYGVHVTQKLLPWGCVPPWVICVIHFNLSWSTCVALLPYGVNGAYLLMKGTAGCQAICFSIKLSWVINCKHTRNIRRVDVWEIQPRRVWARNIRKNTNLKQDFMCRCCLFLAFSLCFTLKVMMQHKWRGL